MIQFLIKYYYSSVPFAWDFFDTSVYLSIYFIKYDTHEWDDKPKRLYFPYNLKSKILKINVYFLESHRETVN